jgi:creatinine amidohydrolase/Fe(II)-dependent formamide hydrolase-like protein
MPLEFAQLSADRLKTLSRETTVFFFPVGPLEDHGPHLSLQSDVIEARELCRLAAERLEREKSGWKGVVMPALPLGVDSNTTEVALTVRAHVLRDWLVDACRSMSRLGFQHFVCFSGNLGPKQLTAIEDAGKLVAGRSRWFRLLRPGSGRAYLASASSALVSGAEVRRSPLIPKPLEHGGARDTSVALAAEASSVDPSYSAQIARLYEDVLGSSAIALGWKRRMRKLSGFWGDPSKASAARGQEILKGTLDDVFPKLRAVWEGANPHLMFRSWYSLIPPNKSFFKAWLLFFSVLIVLMLWISWSLKAVMV